MKKKRVVIKDGQKIEKYDDDFRQIDPLNNLGHMFFSMVNNYNDLHEDRQANGLVLLTDKVGGADFIIGDVDCLVKDLFEAQKRDKTFKEFIEKVYQRVRAIKNLN